MAHAASRKNPFRTTPARSARSLGAQRVGARRNLRDMSFFYTAVAWFITVTVVVSVIVWSRLAVVNTGYEISRANAARSGLIEKNKRLTLELMALKSPERIERIASGKLGLVYPHGEQIVIVR